TRSGLTDRMRTDHASACLSRKKRTTLHRQLLTAVLPTPVCSLMPYPVHPTDRRRKMTLPLLDNREIGDHERVAVVNTRKDVGVITVKRGLYLHLLDLEYQIPEGVKYFCTDIKGRFQAWPIAARITIKGLQHPIPSTGDWFLDVEIAVALKKLSGQELDSGKCRAPFEEHWQAPSELSLLKDPDNPLPDIDFELGWEPGGGRSL